MVISRQAKTRLTTNYFPDKPSTFRTQFNGINEIVIFKVWIANNARLYEPARLHGEAGVHFAECVSLTIDGANRHCPVVGTVAGQLWNIARNLVRKLIPSHYSLLKKLTLRTHLKEFPPLRLKLGKHLLISLRSLSLDFYLIIYFLLVISYFWLSKHVLRYFYWHRRSAVVKFGICLPFQCLN